MAHARSIGSKGAGWHKESVRHSNAKRYGRAGGAYSKIAGKSRIKQGYDNVSYTKPIFKDGERVGTQFVTEKNKEPIVIGLSGKNSDSKRKNKKSRSRFDVMRAEMKAGNIEGMTYKQLKKEGVKLHPLKDSDGDGVKNYKDCRPLNKMAQDNGKPNENFLQRFARERKEKQEKKRMEEDARAKQEIEKLKLEIEKEKLERMKAKEHAELQSQVEKSKEELKNLKDPNRLERIRKRNEFLKETGTKIAKGIANEIKFALKPEKTTKRKKNK